MRKLFAFIKSQWKLILGVAFATVILIATVSGGESFMSSTTFCVSCHSMSYPEEELRDSSHYSSLGIDPECQDCHLPPQFLLRVESHIVDGIRALIGELKHDLSTKKEFDKHRAEYAHNARLNIRKWDSSPCKVCHKDVRPSSRQAEAQHKKMGKEDLTCIDCHQNLVHGRVPKEDLVRGIAEGRIVLQKKKKKKKKKQE
jgi:cytochrome c-type protein NapC